MHRDPYNTLGVARSASDDEVRSAYRKLARELHPDVNPGDAAAEERFKEVSAAYEILSDPEKRKLYDEFGSDALKSGFNAEHARQYKQWAGGFGGGGFDPQGGRVRFEGGGPGEVNFGDIFGDFFGAGGTRPRRGQDVKVRVKIDLIQAIHGSDIQVAVTGRSTPVTVRIPKGADTGSRLRVEGQGAPGSGGAPAGDLVIETEMKPHPHFKRAGLDLILTLPVTLGEAYNGAHIEVPTPSGTVKLRVPPRSQNRSRLRLKGKGIPKGAKTGDLLVELELRLPETDDPELAHALEKSQQHYDDDLRSAIRF